MSVNLDFYFDFSSPYGYFMAEQIDAVAARHGRAVTWRPFLLGAVYKQFGGQPLPSLPLKGPYSVHDFARSARFFGLECAMPENFPVSTQHAARAHYWLHDQDAELARRTSLALYRAYFRDGRDISAIDTVIAIAGAQGVSADALRDVLGSDSAKTRLRIECEAAIVRGVFGSPFVIIDDEPFWGADRLPQIERWLAEGGF